MSEAQRGTTTLPEPAQRGRLVIKDQVVETIARKAALEVASVLRTSSPLNPLSRSLPRVEVTLTSTHARLTLHVATSWDRPLYAVAAEVREHVAETVRRLTGLDVDTVDVQVTSVVQDPTGDEDGGLFGRHHQPERRNLL
ncbi:Asp23/Gls24 family envelope stress response protein [Lapillicoccus jejuensis]|uniref:Putative alkaline shock family protein YloU n=1 Tax=Lapillicoccus jejuensis TaxID=402171 RepID=A0A542DZ11_9MICO|nr:Asp23/Gls24 family envelope stress response protein [Lapillicoccus jejuensis]TQJ08332.1 putative alkaline shock family protein YloU [Lapillicoccus jejuensis]